MKLGIWLLPPIQVVKYWNMGLQTLSNSIIICDQIYIAQLYFYSKLYFFAFSSCKPL